MLAEQAPDLHDALRAGGRAGLVARRAGREGVPYRPLRRDHDQHEGRDDQRLVLREAPRPRRERAGRDAPGRATDLGLRCRARSPPRPDLARDGGVLAALYWSASQLDLPTLADSGYDGAGHGVHTPIKQPGGGQVLAPDNQTYNALLRSVRCRGERGFALLTGRWRALRRITASPRRIGDYVKAALVLTLIEQVQLRTSC